MIGNDIVDLHKAHQESTIFRPRYLEKTLTPTERLLVLDSPQPEFTFWCIWANKEAAYKASQRQFLFKPIFNPTAYEVKFTSSHKAEIKFKNKKYKSYFESNKQFIYSKTLNEYHYSKTLIVANKVQLLKQLSDLYQAPVKLEKDNQGFPYLRLNHSTLNCSISHHGSFFAVEYEC